MSDERRRGDIWLGPSPLSAEQMQQQMQAIADKLTERLNVANATFEIREIRFVIEPELTHAYVLCGPTSDGTLGVQGWHHRAFPSSRNVADIMAEAFRGSDYLMWGQEAP